MTTFLFLKKLSFIQWYRFITKKCILLAIIQNNFWKEKLPRHDPVLKFDLLLESLITIKNVDNALNSNVKYFLCLGILISDKRIQIDYVSLFLFGKNPKISQLVWRTSIIVFCLINYSCVGSTKGCLLFLFIFIFIIKMISCFMVQIKCMKERNPHSINISIR